MTDARLEIRDFAQIAEADIAFGDLTVFVGAQATGKSLSLQWLKAALDGKQVIRALRDTGAQGKTPQEIVELIFGRGMGPAWRDGASRVAFGGKPISPKTLGRTGGDKERVFFVPAHRSMLISDGWALPFQRVTADTPVVARMFSQNLFDRFNDKEAGALFPVEKRLKKEIRDKIDEAFFHGGSVGIEEARANERRLALVHDDMRLPFMTWTAGQREFTPLLLGLYHLLPATKIRKQKDIEWVVIEEPEMGLHPQAITVVMLLVLDLLWRGYRVVLSTHSPHVLTAVWMLRRLKEHRARWKLVCDAFDVQASQQMQRVAEAALEKDYRVHLLSFGSDKKVRATNISTLDPDDPDDNVSGWGGLTEFSSRFGEVVRTAVNEDPR